MIAQVHARTSQASAQWQDIVDFDAELPQAPFEPSQGFIGSESIDKDSARDTARGGSSQGRNDPIADPIVPEDVKLKMDVMPGRIDIGDDPIVSRLIPIEHRDAVSRCRREPADAPSQPLDRDIVR
jgi:hypothetical protein